MSKGTDRLGSGDSVDHVPSTSHGPDSDPTGTAGKSLAVDAAGSTAWNLMAQILQMILGLATAAVLTKWLAPEDYGVFSMATTVVAFVGVFGDGGLSSALVRRSELDPATETTGFVVAMIGAAILTALSLISAPILGLYFKRGDVGLMAVVVATTFLLYAPGRVPGAKLVRQLRFRATSVIGLAGATIANGLAIAAAWSGAGGWSLVVAFLAAPALLSAMFFFWGRPVLHPHLFSRPLARELSTFSAKLSGSALAFVLAWLPSTILLGRVAGVGAMGLYAMGMKLVSLPIARVSGSFAGIFLSAIRRVPSVERRRTYRMTLTMLAMCTAPAACGMFAVADELVKVLPASWSHLAPTLRGFAIGALGESLVSMPTNLLIADGRAGTVFRVGLFTIPLAWFAFAIASWVGGLESFVAAWSALNIASAFVFLAVAAGNVREWLADLHSVGRAILASVLMAGGIHLVLRITGTAGTRLGLPIGVSAGLILYILFARLLLGEEFRRGVRLLLSALMRR